MSCSSQVTLIQFDTVRFVHFSTSCLHLMCLTEAKREEHEQFVQSAVKKQQRNKRKRAPDMFVTAVLECTVRRICSEVCSSYFCLCTPPKRRRLSSLEDKKPTGTVNSSRHQRDKLNTNNFTSKASEYHNSLSEIHEAIDIPETPQIVPGDESEVENFLHSLTVELTELPTLEEVEELLREIECGCDLDTVEEEIGALLKTNPDDPFYPGLLEVLFDQSSTAVANLDPV